MDVATRHQMRIARQTLKMTPAVAQIMGGMDYETAYELVFKTPLRSRLEALITEYGQSPAWLAWELEMYGWKTPAELLNAL